MQPIFRGSTKEGWLTKKQRLAPAVGEPPRKAWAFSTTLAAVTVAPSAGSTSFTERAGVGVGVRVGVRVGVGVGVGMGVNVGVGVGVGVGMGVKVGVGKGVGEATGEAVPRVSIFTVWDSQFLLLSILMRKARTGPLELSTVVFSVRCRSLPPPIFSDRTTRA